MREDLSALIQRNQETEQRFGVRLEALYAYREGTWIHANGDIHSMSSDPLEKSLKIMINLYDGVGRLLGSNSEYVDSEEFSGFDSFSTLENLDNEASNVARILIFVKIA